MLEKLKKRWNINSNWQILLILITFSVTGSLSVMIRKPIFLALDITSATSLWIRIPLSILIITPTYQVLLLVVGTLLGQFRFFWNFQKKMISRFSRKKKDNSNTAA